MNLTIIEPEQAEQFAPHVQRLMEGRQFPEPIPYDWRFVVEKAKANRWQIWFLFEDGEPPEMMMVTFVSTLPVGRICNLELVTGEGFLQLAAKSPVFEAWCRAQNIFRLTANTPAPLAKYARRWGWKSGNTSVYKDLETRN